MYKKIPNKAFNCISFHTTIVFSFGASLQADRNVHFLGLNPVMFLESCDTEDQMGVSCKEEMHL